MHAEGCAPVLFWSEYSVVSQNWGYLFGGANKKDYNILRSILGSPYFGKLPFVDTIRNTS